jgi:hypothetical protein
LIPIPLYPVRPIGFGSGLFSCLRKQLKFCPHRWPIFRPGKNQPQKLDPTTEHRFVSTGKQEISRFSLIFWAAIPFFLGIKVSHAKLAHLILFRRHVLPPVRQS